MNIFVSHSKDHSFAIVPTEIYNEMQVKYKASSKAKQNGRDARPASPLFFLLFLSSKNYKSTRKVGYSPSLFIAGMFKISFHPFSWPKFVYRATHTGCSSKNVTTLEISLTLSAR